MGKDLKEKFGMLIQYLLPKDFKSVYPVKSAMAQISPERRRPSLMFQFTDLGYYADRQLNGIKHRK